MWAFTSTKPDIKNWRVDLVANTRTVPHTITPCDEQQQTMIALSNPTVQT